MITGVVWVAMCTVTATTQPTHLSAHPKHQKMLEKRMKQQKMGWGVCGEGVQVVHLPPTLYLNWYLSSLKMTDKGDE